MYLSHGPPRAHYRAGVLRAGESIQCVASNPTNDIVVAVSQLQVHFWNPTPSGGFVYLSSIDVPRASLDDDYAVSALWHPHYGNRLVVVTSRRAVFMEADLHVSRETFLGCGEVSAMLKEGTNTGPRTVPFCDVRSRVCCSEEVTMDSGIVCSVNPAGPCAFLVTTTAGAVKVIGWSARRVLHSFTVFTLRGGGHAFALAGETSPVSSHVDPAQGPERYGSRRGSDIAGVGADGGEADVPPARRRLIHDRVLTGAILHAAFCPRLSLFSLVLSSGYVLLARPSCGPNLAAPEMTLHGHVIPATAACMTCIGGTRALLVIATHTGTLTGHRLQPGPAAASAWTVCSMTPLWRYTAAGTSGATGGGGGGAGGNGVRSGSTAARAAGPVSSLEWSSGGQDVLAVGFYRVGATVLHHSGACLMTTFPTDAAVTSTLLGRRSTAVAGVWDDASPAPPDRPTLSGCVGLQWCLGGRRLLAVEPQGERLVSFALARVVSVAEVGPHPGTHTPLCALGEDGLFLMSYTDGVELHGQSCYVMPLLTLTQGVPGALPLRYAAVSASGRRIAAAGRRGLLLYDRQLGLWSGLATPAEAASLACVCDPIWLSGRLVAVATAEKDRYAVVVFHVDGLSLKAAVARHPLEARPTRLSVTCRPHRADGFLVVQDVRHRLHLTRFNVFHEGLAYGRPAPRVEQTRVVLTPLRCVELDDPAVMGDRPLEVLPVCLGGASGVDDVPALVLLNEPDHALLLLHPTGDEPLTTRARQFQTVRLTARTQYTLTRLTPAGTAAFAVWVDRFSPLGGLNLCVYEEGGLVYYHVATPVGCGAEGLARASVSSTLPVPWTGEGGVHEEPASMMRLCIASRETELVPLCLSPYDGCALAVAEARAVAAHARSTGEGPLRPLLYSPRVLSLLLWRSLREVRSSPRPEAGGAPGAVVGAAPPGVPAVPAAVGEVGGGGGGGSRRGSALPTAPGTAVAPEGRARAFSGQLAATFTWDDTFFYWLQTMRENGSFTPAFDSFLLSVLDDSPPGGIAQLDRKSAVRAVVGLLRSFPEFYEIMVGCVRRIDMTRWHLVLDFLGSPLDLYQECIDHNRFTEAVHLVRVIMMSTYAAESEAGSGAEQRAAALQQACGCAVALFDRTLRNGDYASAYDLLRFTALVRHEIGMPASVSAEAGDGASGGGSVVGRWLRTLMGPGRATVASPNAVGAVKNCPSLFLLSRHTDGRGSVGSDRASVPGPRSTWETEEVQRREATRVMFQTYPALPRAVEDEAGRLLESGHFIQLCRLLEVFSLSLDAFLQAQCVLRAQPSAGGGSSSAQHVSGGAGAAAAASMTSATASGPGQPADGTRRCPEMRPLSLASLFDGVHRELGLPRSARPVGAGGTAVLCSPGSPMEESMRAWTQAQVALYGNRRILGEFTSVQALVGGRHVYVDLVFALVAMSSADVLALLTRPPVPLCGGGEDPLQPCPATPPVSTTEAVEAWTPARISHCVALLAELSSLVELPANTGYAGFVATVVAALPPNMLQASGRLPRLPAAEAEEGVAVEEAAAALAEEGPVSALSEPTPPAPAAKDEVAATAVV